LSIGDVVFLRKKCEEGELEMVCFYQVASLTIFQHILERTWRVALRRVACGQTRSTLHKRKQRENIFPEFCGPTNENSELFTFVWAKAQPPVLQPLATLNRFVPSAGTTPLLVSASPPLYKFASSLFCSHIYSLSYLTSSFSPTPSPSPLLFHLLPLPLPQLVFPFLFVSS
jgi:hypothetical protein